MIFNEHINKLVNRNAAVADKCPEHYRETFITNIKWARELNKTTRLGAMDYDVREETIDKIKSILEGDYKRAGFNLSEDAETLDQNNTFGM